MAVALLVTVALLAGVGESRAASVHSAPQTGLEGGMRHSYGPEGEGKRDPRYSVPMPNDAYGNPIRPMEEPERKRYRARPGAYGASGGAQDAPLPKLPEHDAGWNFK